MKSVIRWMIHPPVTGPASIFIIRLLSGGLFGYEAILSLQMLNNGISIFVFAIGQLLGCMLLAGGLFTRITAFFLVIYSISALFYNSLSGPNICCEYAQIMGCVFLILEGAGRWSMDFYIATHRQPIFKINQNK